MIIYFQTETGTTRITEELAKKSMAEVIELFEVNNQATKMKIEITIIKEELIPTTNKQRFYFYKEN